MKKRKYTRLNMLKRKYVHYDDRTVYAIYYPNENTIYYNVDFDYKYTQVTIIVSE